jgi:hypothetical protein
LDSDRWTEVGLACGYKINDYASRSGACSILDLAQARERHVELHWLRHALQAHNAIPNGFDDRLPDESLGDGEVPRLLIGSTYLVPNETGEEELGVLVDATVLESERAAHGMYKLQDGRHIMCTSPLTDTELGVYKRSPTTFFGVIKKISETIREPLDCYDFFWGVYSTCSREKLLNFISGWSDYATLAKLDQKELAQNYCARMAELMWHSHQRGTA